MKLIRIILFPVVPIYYLVTWLRNWLYDHGFKSSKSYDIPIICVGNLSTGGTGKTPMIEYLIRLLKENKSLATLSRGYKRITEGFILADEFATTDTIGDEPFQFFRKFDDVVVAVDGNRQNGISQLLSLPRSPEVILLDDAYQHRKVKAGFNILLTSFDDPYFKDIVLPTGNLREPRSGAIRADVIVITKCPIGISVAEQNELISKLKVREHQKVFFSYIDYSENVISKTKELPLNQLPKFTLVTGIANANPLVDFLEERSLTFEHVEYPDHYSFKPTDIEKLSKKGMIVTTEKDYVRLADYENLEPNLFYLPIQTKINDSVSFDAEIQAFVN